MEIFPPRSTLRRYGAYFKALITLIFAPKNCRKWFTRHEPSQDLSNWEMGIQKYYFFDIDDTLNGHGQGLTQVLLTHLLQRVPQGSPVVLLTNCSKGRADRHRLQLQAFAGKIELWPVGMKPDYTWLRQALLLRGWEPADCAMFGDRPTMDLYMAYRAGFGCRVWVQAWGVGRPWRSPLQWIQNLEWALFSGTA